MKSLGQSFEWAAKADYDVKPGPLRLSPDRLIFTGAEALSCLMFCAEHGFDSHYSIMLKCEKEEDGDENAEFFFASTVNGVLRESSNVAKISIYDLCRREQPTWLTLQNGKDSDASGRVITFIDVPRAAIDLEKYLEYRKKFVEKNQVIEILSAQRSILSP